MIQLTISDQTTAGETTGACVLDVLTEKITVRELIRSRVYQEVQDHNVRKRQDQEFRGLVTPKDATRGARREINFKEQFSKACDAFERNGFFILVDEKQAETLDEEITLHHHSLLTFVKLVPLVGG